MTVSSSFTDKVYQISGSSTVYPWAQELDTQYGSLVVTEETNSTDKEVVQTFVEGEDYNIVNKDVVFVTAPTDTDHYIRITRNTYRGQPVKFNEGEDFPAEDYEQSLDRFAMSQQEQDKALAEEKEARIKADEILQENIDAEAEARRNADITLQQNIDNEALARQNADITLQGNIDAEETRAKAAEKAINETLDTFGDIVTHDADEFAKPSDIGDGTISLIQGGVVKGTFTTNQGGDTSIELDAGGGGDERVGLRFNFMVTFPENSDQIEVDVSDIMPDGKYYPIVFVSDNLNSKDLNRQVAYDCENKTVRLKRNPDIIREESFATQYVMLPVNTQTNLINGQSNGQFIPSDKNLYYTKTEVNTIASGKQDNLTTAQLNAVNSGITSAKVTQYDGYATSIDSQNGTISNCILEIPQNIKLTLENNVLTLKAGSILTLTGSTYATTTTAEDRTLTSFTANQRLVIFPLLGGGLFSRNITIVSSGNTDNIDSTPTHLYYNTDNKLIYLSGAVNNDLSYYPICVIDVDSNGVASFAKFSDGRDGIFNGLGFVGQTKFIYPNVKVLEPIGKNADGTLKSIEYTTNSLQLSTNGGTYNRRMFINGNVFQITANNWHYVEDDNMYYDHNNVPFTNGCIDLGNCFSVNDIVTNFTIRQPYKGARNLLTDDIEEQIGDIETALTTIIGA